MSPPAPAPAPALQLRRRKCQSYRNDVTADEGLGRKVQGCSAMSDLDSVVVVGAGIAGLRACESLRSRGHGGRLVLVGDEHREPYDRPPLSKQYLAGTWNLDRVVLRTPEFLADLSIERRSGPENAATGLDVAGRFVRLASGEQVGYDGLVVATGARARRLPGLDHVVGVHTLRTIEDADRLSELLHRPGARLLLVGAGFIGLEVAATARGLGADVAIVEPLDVPLQRSLGRLPGTMCQRMHEANGVRLHLGTTVVSVAQSGDGTIVAELSDGVRVEADGLLVGIGAAPNVGWLENSGLEVGPSGVACDETLLAAPGVVAAGDVARWLLPGPDGQLAPVRVEHRTTAAEQGDHAAATLLGGREPFAPVPYVWSDQYAMKIQVLGLPQPEDETVVVAGEPSEGRAVIACGRAGRLAAVIGFGMPRALMQLRPLLVNGADLAEASRLLG